MPAKIAREILPVGLGSGLGATMQAWIGSQLTPGFSSNPPALLLANLTGCLLIGLLAGFASRGVRWVSSGVRQRFLMSGLCGGFTTFSLFALQGFLVLQSDAWTAFLALSVGTLVGGVLAAAAGWMVARRIAVACASSDHS